MKLKEYYLVFFIVTLLLSCTNNKYNQKAFYIDIHNTKLVSIKDQFESISLIPLHTNKESIIGQIVKIIPYDNKFFVLDYKQKIILIFDSSGEYQYNLNKKGKGPGEYSDISDFEINPFTGNIEILSPWGQIYVYNISGRFINSYEIPKIIEPFHFLKFVSKDQILLYSMTGENRIFIFDRILNEIDDKRYIIPEHILTGYFTTFFPFYSFDGKVHIRENFSNEVCIFEENKIIAKYKLDFGELNPDLKKMPSENKLKTHYADLIMNGGGDEFVYPFYTNLENSNSIFSVFGYGGKFIHLIYNKNDKTYTLFDKYKEGVRFPCFFSTVLGNNEYISVVEPSQINEFIKPELLSPENQFLLKNIKIEDNPVIIKYKLKPF